MQTDASNASANATAVRTKFTGSIPPTDVAGYDAAQLGTARICYQSYLDPFGTTWSIQISAAVTYRYPLAVPLISNIIDAIDGTNDGALAISATSASRVENASFTASDPLPGGAICQS